MDRLTIPGQRVDLSSSDVVSSAADPLVLILGRPNTGIDWDLRRLSIVSAENPQVEYPGVVLIVAGSSETRLDPGSIVDSTTCGLPSTATYAEGTIKVQSTEVLQVWCFGLPVGLAVLATAQCTPLGGM